MRLNECEWIIFYDYNTGRHNCAALGSMSAMKADGMVVKTIMGTEKEARQYARRLDIERKVYTGDSKKRTVGSTGKGKRTPRISERPAAGRA